MRRVTDPRLSRILVNTRPEIKKQLEGIAKERGWSLSLLCHEILRAWLKDTSLAWVDQVGEESEHGPDAQEL